MRSGTEDGCIRLIQRLRPSPWKVVSPLLLFSPRVPLHSTRAGSHDSSRSVSVRNGDGDLGALCLVSALFQRLDTKASSHDPHHAPLSQPPSWAHHPLVTLINNPSLLASQYVPLERKDARAAVMQRSLPTTTCTTSLSSAPTMSRTSRSRHHLRPLAHHPLSLKTPPSSEL